MRLLRWKSQYHDKQSRHNSVDWEPVRRADCIWIMMWIEETNTWLNRLRLQTTKLYMHFVPFVFGFPSTAFFTIFAFFHTVYLHSIFERRLFFWWIIYTYLLSQKQNIHVNKCNTNLSQFDNSIDLLLNVYKQTNRKKNSLIEDSMQFTHLLEEARLSKTIKNIASDKFIIINYY